MKMLFANTFMNLKLHVVLSTDNCLCLICSISLSGVLFVNVSVLLDLFCFSVDRVFFEMMKMAFLDKAIVGPTFVCKVTNYIPMR